MKKPKNPGLRSFVQDSNIPFASPLMFEQSKSNEKLRARELLLLAVEQKIFPFNSKHLRDAVEETDFDLLCGLFLQLGANCNLLKRSLDETIRQKKRQRRKRFGSLSKLSLRMSTKPESFCDDKTSERKRLQSDNGHKVKKTEKREKSAGSSLSLLEQFSLNKTPTHPAQIGKERLRLEDLVTENGELKQNKHSSHETLEETTNMKITLKSDDTQIKQKWLAYLDEKLNNHTKTSNNTYTLGTFNEPACKNCKQHDGTQNAQGVFQRLYLDAKKVNNSNKSQLGGITEEDVGIILELQRGRTNTKDLAYFGDEIPVSETVLAWIKSLRAK
eukprot:snap_masked-scaffold_28-processed-gene-2.32-mRNA-1 protein AED:1.00 eAED:1.00 QI:0/-1/0/0/-1/1/1/0/329